MNDAVEPPIPRLVSSEFIYQSAPFPSCHAATITETSRGKILAAWFGGTHESHPDVCIYLSELTGTQWSAPRKAAEGRDENGQPLACYNPVLLQPSHGPLLLFYKVGRGPQTWWGMLAKSTDDGVTWSTPSRLPEGIFGPIKNRPLELPDGTLLCPSSSEDHGWRVHFESTKDFGESWTRTDGLNDAAKIGAIQPSLLTLPNGRLRAIGRTQQGRVFSIDSADLGKTWGTMTLTDLPNPNSGCDAITLRDGRHLLVYNNTSRGRTPLTVAISQDAEAWTNIITLEDSPGEFSYPTVIQASNGDIHIVYTWNRTRIRHVVLALR